MTLSRFAEISLNEEGNNSEKVPNDMTQLETKIWAG